MRTLLTELRRRGVFRLAAVYIIGAWVIMQVADVFFPAWDIPDAALRSLLAAAVLGFPVALVFGWLYDLTADGIKRTPPADADELAKPHPLRTGDYVTLAGLLIAVGLILYSVYDNIRETAGQAEKPTAVAEALPNSVAVLPFANISDDTANDFFCDGVTEEILHRLSDYRDMHVLARTSSFAFRDAEMAPAQMTRILGVRYLVQGSVRKAGNRLRISASLVDHRGFQLWSESYDRELSSVFDIQSEIAASVAGRLAETILASYAGTSDYTPAVEAYREFLLGREYLHNRIAGFQEKAAGHFEAALQIDPDYPDPYAGKAIAILLRHASGGTRQATGDVRPESDDWIEESGNAIDRSLALDPDLAIGRAAKGLRLQMVETDFEAAEAELRRALLRDPNVIGAANWLVNSLQGQEKWAEARTARAAALQRDPLNPILVTNQSIMLSRAGDFEAAERLLLRLMQLPRPPGTSVIALHGLYEEYGRLREALDTAQRIALEYARDPRRLATLGYVVVAYARLGMWDAASYWQDTMEAAMPGAVQPRLNRALFLLRRGELEGLAQVPIDVAAVTGIDDPLRMPPFVRQVLGAIHVLTGRTSLGVELLESAYSDDLSDIERGDFQFLTTLAFGQRLLGNAARADEIFAAIQDRIDAIETVSGGRSPEILVSGAMNHAVAGNRAAALHELENAVEIGERDYYGIVNDIRWSAIEQEPRFLAITERLEAEVEAYRSEVESSGDVEDFKARFDGLRGD
jgi:TolB-like protein